MENYFYAYRVHLRDGEEFTLANLKETLRVILIDDELTFRQKFPAHIIVDGLSLDELTRCIDQFDVRDRAGIIPDSGYAWKLLRVVAGEQHPEVHVMLTSID